MKKLNVVLLGVGTVGGAWLNGFTEQFSRLRAILDIKLIAVANSTRFMKSDIGLTKSAIENVAKSGELGSLNDLLTWLDESQYESLVIIDATASEEVARRYFEFAERGWHIISANKRALTFSTERYGLLQSIIARSEVYWGTNATVGAALPVQRSLAELSVTGDQIIDISGILSGSLSYLLANYQPNQSFCELIAIAKRLGLSEPDPRDDLSGTDVQRKLLILMRQAGVKASLDDIEVEPLLPAQFTSGTLAEFWQRADEIDSWMAERFYEAQSENKKLVFLANAKLENRQFSAKVGLQFIDDKSALANVAATDNIIAIQSGLYANNPLIIQGPGAGAEITANALNIDLHYLATSLGLETASLTTTRNYA